MWFPLSTVAALCMLLDHFDAKIYDKELEMAFRQRTRSDWERLWHQEKHARCRESIVKHMKWACEKDIYRITRRSDFTNIHEMFPWIQETRAKRMIRLRRSGDKRRSSITNECCSSAGCTWEEYAEYCPTNKRITPFV